MDPKHNVIKELPCNGFLSFHVYELSQECSLQVKKKKFFASGQIRQHLELNFRVEVFLHGCDPELKKDSLDLKKS